MSSAFETRSGDHFFLLAAITAVMAAVFMVTVWAPLQVRAFDAAGTSRVEPAPRVAGWERISFETADAGTTGIVASNGQVRVVQSAPAAN